MDRKYYVWRIAETGSWCEYDGTYEQCREYVASRTDTGLASYVIEGE